MPIASPQTQRGHEPSKVKHMPSLKSLQSVAPAMQRLPLAPASELLSTLLQLLGESIVNTHGEPLGTIDDLLVDPVSGRIIYVVMPWGGFMGRGERQLVLPWNALRHDVPRRAYVLDIDRQHLDTAPSIDRSRWPGERSLEWHRAVHRHYGVPAPS